MKITLEKRDLMTILEKHFDVVLKEEDVFVQADPFEVTMTGIPLVEDETPRQRRPNDSQPRLSAVPNTVATSPEDEAKWKERQDDNAIDEPPPFDESEIEGGRGSDASFHPAAMLAESKKLAEAISKANPNLGKPAVHGSSNAPGDFNKEV